MSNEKEEFLNECIMNSSSIYDRRLFNEEFKKIYNDHKFNFLLKNNYLSNNISKWKQNGNRFKKTTVLNNATDYQNRNILKEYRSL